MGKESQRGKPKVFISQVPLTLRVDPKAYDLSTTSDDKMLDSKVYPESGDVLSQPESNKDEGSLEATARRPNERLQIDDTDSQHSKDQLKRNLLKRFIIYALFLVLFIASIFTRDIASRLTSDESTFSANQTTVG